MLLPREHGVYGQLLFPLLAAWLIGRPAAGAYLLGAAAVAAFLGHESLLVVLGQRGAKATREQGADARRSLAMFGGFCAVTGVVSLTLLPWAALQALLVTAVLGGLVVVAVVMHRERSTMGEILVSLALASVAMPVALAGQVSRVDALTLVVVFASVFICATVAVRGLIGRVSKAGGPSPIVAGALTLGVVVGLAGAAFVGQLAPIAPYAALPMCAVALGLTASPPNPRHLRAIGWTLVGATLLSAILLVAGLA